MYSQKSLFFPLSYPSILKNFNFLPKNHSWIAWGLRYMQLFIYLIKLNGAYLRNHKPFIIELYNLLQISYNLIL